MKTMTKVLAAILCIFVVSACGSKFDSKKADELISKYKEDQTSFTEKDYTEVVKLATALTKEETALVKKAVDAMTKVKDAEDAEQLIAYEKFQQENKEAIDLIEKYDYDLSKIVKRGVRNGDIKEYSKEYKALLDAQAELKKVEDEANEALN